MSVATVLMAAVPVLLVMLFLQFRWKYRHILAAAGRLPCPPALPAIGNAYMFIGSIGSITKYVITLTHKFKQVFCIWIGPVPLFVVHEPADVQIILNSSNMLEKDDIYDFLKPFLGNGLLTAPVPMWKMYRRLISPLLQPVKVETFLPVFNEVSRKVTQRFTDAPRIDPRKGLFIAALDASLKSLFFKESVMDEESKLKVQDLFYRVGKMFVERLFKVWLHIDWLFNIVYYKEMRECLDNTASFYALIDKHIDSDSKERADGSQELLTQEERIQLSKTNFVDLIHNNLEEPKGHRWSDEVSTMIVGATDTVVSAMSFMLVTLANYPDVQAKVHKEIDEVLGGTSADVTLSELHSMTYLGQTILEVMRLHGTFPIISRKATKDTKLSSGTILPAGSRVILPLHAMGWDTETFPEPDKFIPERFAPENACGRHKYAFVPFSGGPRNCVGKMYAILLMKTVMVHLLQRFEVKSDVRLEDIEYQLKVVLCTDNPLPIDFVPRKICL